MRKIRNFLCFFICSFYLYCPTTEEQITDRQVLLGVTRKVLSNSKHTLLCLCGHNVLERMLVQGGVLLVESSEQGLVFGAYALIGVSHHFSGNERLTVGKSLVMLGDLKAFLLL